MARTSMTTTTGSVPFACSAGRESTTREPTVMSTKFWETPTNASLISMRLGRFW